MLDIVKLDGQRLRLKSIASRLAFYEEHWDEVLMELARHQDAERSRRDTAKMILESGTRNYEDALRAERNDHRASG